MSARPICRQFEAQADWRAFSRARAKTGNRIAARMAMMAITTSSSIRVKARWCGRRIDGMDASFTRLDRLPADLFDVIDDMTDGGDAVRSPLIIDERDMPETVVRHQKERVLDGLGRFQSGWVGRHEVRNR